ncbi:MAG: hypothetical protein AAGA58_13320 [Verrucomicrobiota bacterium]
MTAAQDNPFATERVEEILEFDPTWIGETWESILGNLEQINWHGAVVGPHGAGKTTFLSALQKRLNERGKATEMLFLNRQSREIPEVFFEKLTPETIILFDGAEQLNFFQWRKFLGHTRQTRGLIISLHRPGRLPTFLRLNPTPTLLHQCINRLAPSSHIDPTNIFTTRKGNLREALLDCYDLHATR